MNYLDATRGVLLKRAIGLAVLVLCGTVTLISLLKFLYFGFDQGGPLLTGLAQALKRLVYAVYAKTQFLGPIWQYAPVPNQLDIWSSGNLFFLVWYFGVFVGLSILTAANRLAARLKRIDLEIEDELIRQSVRNTSSRTREQIEKSTDVPRQSPWKEIHTLYVAPIVVGFILLVLGKLFGLT